MGAFYGRKVVFEWDDNEVDGVREKSLSVNGEPVNVTSDEDDGIQILLEEDAELGVTIELSGVTKSDVLLNAKLNGDLTNTATLTYPNGAVISGTFQLGNYTEGQAYADATTFTATLMSSGPVTYTPGSS
jgi:predicted secreted protein